MPGILISPPLWVGEQFLSKLKNREEFDGGLHEKKEGKRREKKKKEKREKEKKSPKTGKNFNKI